MKNPTKAGSAARTLFLLGILSALAVTSVQAQNLVGRWRVDLRTAVGVLVNAGTSTSASGVETKTDAAGFLGGLGLSRWFRENLAGQVSLGVLSVHTDTRAGAGGVSTETALVTSFFVGVRRYLTPSDPESGTGFFGSVEVGPVTGHQSSTSVGSAVVVESITRSAFGGRAGVGVEFRLGNRVMLGLGGGYTFMTDFADAIGGEKNHSGADLGLSLGVLFGG
ncbi:MAG: PorT family protein [Gemmatimonadetes bacterium]|nr:PorT family protein [Gemmatimonadota bacterium]